MREKTNIHDDSIQLMDAIPPISARELVKVYAGDVRALASVSFDVNKGEIFGLLGPNGAGKSTCMKIFSGILKPTQGQAFIEGVDVVKDPLNAKARIGFLPEFPSLFENLTGREFLTMMAMLRGMEKSYVDTEIERFSKNLALEDALDRLLGTYSKGMRQKISFTATIMHRPPVLLLDEPTSGLDPRFAKYIKNIVGRMGKEGHSILLSTHITSVAEELCGRIAIIDKGAIAAIGTVEEVISHTGADTLEDAFIRVVGDASGTNGVSDAGDIDGLGDG